MKSERKSQLGRVALSRSLSLPVLIIFGLTYLGLGAAFTVYGSGVEITDGRLPAAFLVATVAMLFTAVAYAVMARENPKAGSAYSYATEAFGPHIGFLTGWAMLIDYILIPMINFLLIGIYAAEQWPILPQWAWTLASLLFVWVLNLIGVTANARLNIIAVALSSITALSFAVLSIIYSLNHPTGVNPMAGFIPNHGFGPIMAGASVLALSFLGFDAVSAMSEEAKRPTKDVPRAIIATVAIGGCVFMLIAWAGSLIVPDWKTLTNLDAAGIEMMTMVGGTLMSSFFVFVYVAGSVFGGSAAQASVSRVLFAMGRDRVLPGVFAYVHPKSRTPVVAATVVAAVSLIALFIDLDTAISVINFGALTAFSMVNAAVIKTKLFRPGRRSAWEIVAYGITPLIGLALTVWLWTSLTSTALTTGLIWTGVGVLLLLVQTRGFRRRPKALDFTEEPVAIISARAS